MSYNPQKYKEYYQKNRERIIKRVSEQRKAHPEVTSAWLATPEGKASRHQANHTFRQKWLAQIETVQLFYGCMNPKCPSKHAGHTRHQLDFHHIDPNDKEYSVASMNKFPYKRLAKEINKCVLLCANCHRDLHHNDISIPNDIRCRVDDNLTPL
jgi:hypothetical protein